MTTYKGINGFAVQSVASDPSPLDEGQVWYNNATYAFKLASVTTSGSWATGGNLGTSRYRMGSAGIQTAGLIFGGVFPAGPPYNRNQTEKYDGTSWTSSGTMPAERFGMGSGGTQTAAIGFGGGQTEPFGSPPQVNATITFNGTSWTTPPATLNTARTYIGPAATQTAAIGFGGYIYPGTVVNNAESYNGTSWTTVTNYPTTVRDASAAGTQTAALGFAGYTPPTSSTNKIANSWNGTTWTSSPNLNNNGQGRGGFGTQTAAVAAGGGSSPAPLASVETWNGTSWTNNTATSNNLGFRGGLGTISSGLVAGGTPGNPITAVEEWTGPGVAQTKTITTS